MISRHENERCPVAVQEPQRLDLVAEADRLDADAEHHGVAERRALEVALRLALQEIDDAARQMTRGRRGRASPARPRIDRPSPCRAPPRRGGCGAARRGAAGPPSAIGCGLRQLAHLADQPAGMAVEEGARLGQRAARRHGEHRRAWGAADAERVVPRPRMTAERDATMPRSVATLEVVGARLPASACGRRRPMRRRLGRISRPMIIVDLRRKPMNHVTQRGRPPPRIKTAEPRAPP